MNPLDRVALRWARTHGHTPATERAVRMLSSAGENGGVWFAIGLIGSLADRDARPCWRHGMRVVGEAYAINTILKLIVRRRRPRLPDLPPLARTPTTLSFPSAHAATSFAGARVYSRCGAPSPPLYALACALAASRVYLGVHHPTDVIAGALLGDAVAAPRP